jgi:hypothetical protein
MSEHSYQPEGSRRVLIVACIASASLVAYLRLVTPAAIAQVTPGTGNTRCAISESQTTCIVCDNCKYDYRNKKFTCDGNVLGGASCHGNQQAVCTVSGDDWEASCVSSS